jgi:quercetin dioxygenase-like cupin family protein
MSTHIIMSQTDGVSHLAAQPAPAFSPQEFPGWQGLALKDSGVFMFIFDIEAGAAEYPLHSSEDEWLAYVVSGSGELHSGNPEGELLDMKPFAAGDFITFRANTQHAWRNGDHPSRILFVKRSG